MFEPSDELRRKQSTTCHLKHMSPFFSRSLNLDLLHYLEELVFEVPEALAQMRFFFGPAAEKFVEF